MKAILASVVLALGMTGGASWAQTPLRIGLIDDLTGFYSPIAGQGSIVAAQMAIDDFGGKVLGRPVELLTADHQNKPDIASALAREWIEQSGVKFITGVANSSAALAVRNITKERGIIDVNSSAGTTELYNKACAKTGFHWVYDSYSLAKGTAQAVVKDGGKSWFFLTTNYSYGALAQADATHVIEANAGKVEGAVKVPPNAPEFSSYLFQAQSSPAEVVGFAIAGGDFINAVKQASEFGLSSSGKRLAALVAFISDIHALGLDVAQGMYITEPFYWGMDDKTRAWSERFYKKMNAMPTSPQAGAYSAVLHYLKAVEAAGTDESGAVADRMRALPVNDFWSDNLRIREDGRVLRPVHLFKVKKPSDSKRPWDYYQYVSTISGEDAARPLSESECPYLKK